MTITPLSAEETRQSGFTHKLELTYADFTAEATTVAFEIFPKLTTSTTFAAGTRVNDCAIYVPTIFVAASMTDLSIIIGDGGDTDRLLATAEIGGTSTPISAGTYYDGVVANLPHTYSSADTIDLIATATGAALSALTAGELTVYLSVSDLTAL